MATGECENLRSWEEFERRVHQVDAKWLQQSQNSLESTPSRPLYRGQSNAEWNLTSTLDRNKRAKDCSVEGYHHLIRCIEPMIHTYTGKRFDIPDTVEDFHSFLINKKLFLSVEYMVFLRHYGFPSPLLDWTRSPYIAAYFAFADPNSESRNVSISIFQETNGNGKSGWVGAPTIQSIGHTLRSDKRHFQQQSEYTFCCKKVDEKWHYCSHEEVFSSSPDRSRTQDFLTKITLPGSERIHFLRKLDQMNINALSLFGGDAALMDTLTIREIDLGNQIF